MPIFKFAAKAFFRQSRSGEVLVMIAAISMAVASLSAVGFLTDRISLSIEKQASELLAADLRISSPEPIPEEWIDLAKERKLDLASSQSFPSVVYSQDGNALARIKAVSSMYPLRGTVRISDNDISDEYEVKKMPSPSEVWVDQAILYRLNAEIGDEISIGNSDFKITAILRYRPDQSIGFASLSPTVLMNISSIPGTGLITEGSRVNYSMLIAGENNEVQTFSELMSVKVNDSARISNPSDSSERTNQTINRSKQFLSLTVIISVLLSGIAISMSARRFAKKRMDMIALMKSFGAKRRFILQTIIIQLTMIGLTGVILGSIMGFIVENLVANLIADLFMSELPSPTFQTLFIGLLAAFILLPGFAFSSLLQLSNTSAIKVLRKNAIPAPPSELFITGGALLSLSILLYYFVRDIELLAVIILGMLIISLLLFFIGQILAQILGSLRGGFGASWRYGLANVSRRGRDSAIQIVAFGLSLTALLLLSLIRTDLLTDWQKALGENTPNYFLINIQSYQTEGIREILKSSDGVLPEFVPLVRARMTEINGQSVQDRSYPDERGNWLANREANLSWSKTVNSKNKVMDGSWWSADYKGPPLVSIERSAAEDMGVAVGDNLTFLIAGENITAEISSIREVDWNSFSPNFFLVFSPNSLDTFPSSFISSMYLDKSENQILKELQINYPTVSVVDLDPILQQVRQVITKVSIAVQAVFIFTLIAGITVLFSAVHSTIDERKFESALLRAVGMKKRNVIISLLSEFSAIGLSAGILAASGASILAWQIASRFFEISYIFNLSLWLAGIVCGVVLVSLFGYIASRDAIKSPPVNVLRNT